MKYTPKNVFILEDGRYKEISYEEHHKLQKTDKAYADKLFLLLHGSLMEVTEDTYRIYHKTRCRQKYIDECSYKNRDFSYDSLGKCLNLAKRESCYGIISMTLSL